MSYCIEQPKQVCALGAQQSVLAIDRAIPIVHGGPGCGFKLFGGLAFYNGFQGSGYAGGNAIVSSNTGETEVVFGGEKRLDELIEWTLKVMDGDLFVVLTACTADLIGDDTASVVKKYRNKGIKIVHAETAGFKGNNYIGHEIVIEAIIEQLFDEPQPVAPGLVNVWSVIPYQDTFWRGNLQAIKDLLSGLGLEVNILFGPDAGGLAEWERIPAAQFNLVLSPWVGLKAAKLLYEKFGTPYLHYPVLPVGATETSLFLKTVADFAGISELKSKKFIGSKESRFYYYIDHAADFFLELRWDLPSKFINIGDAYNTLGISRFLINDLSMLPGHQFITDNPPEEYRTVIASSLNKPASKMPADITFCSDGGEIHRLLKTEYLVQSPLIIGSSWDKDIAKQLDGYHLSLSLPITDRLVLDRGYVGYEGGLRLVEDVYATVLGGQQ